jgi:hypothetical protein
MIDIIAVAGFILYAALVAYLENSRAANYGRGMLVVVGVGGVVMWGWYRGSIDGDTCWILGVLFAWAGLPQLIAEMVRKRKATPKGEK